METSTDCGVEGLEMWSYPYHGLSGMLHEQDHSSLSPIFVLDSAINAEEPSRLEIYARFSVPLFVK